MEFGLEVSQLFNISLPPFVGAALLLAFNTGANQLRISRWNIRRSLLQKNPKWGEDEEALDFMLNWTSYCLKPTTERWRNLNELSAKYSEREGLFAFLCKLLLKSGFSTFIILLDEVSGLPPRQMKRLIKHLREKSGTMNLILICAGLPDIRSDIINDETFRRRCWWEDDVFELFHPTIFSRHDDKDDFSFAKEKIIRLCHQIGISHRKPDEETEKKVRLDLASQKGKPVTWSVLWENISMLYNPLHVGFE